MTSQRRLATGKHRMAPHRLASTPSAAMGALPAAGEAPAEPGLAGAALPPLLENMQTALLDSRNRWRALVTLVADLAFETDQWGRFVFIAPDPALGWPATTLLGQPAELLLASTDGTIGFNPFRPPGAVRRRRAWLKRPDGRGVCLSFAAAPLCDDEGRVVGSRGIGQDTTEQDGYDSAIAAALRRGEVIDHILWCMRQEVLAPRMMEAVLSSLATALGAEGAAVLDLLRQQSGHGVRFATRAPPDAVAEAAFALLHDAASEDAALGEAPGGEKLLACATQSRFGEPAGLALWRAAGGRNWDGEERALAASATGIIRLVLDHDSIQQEMARQARTDPLTGLLNRRAFLEELERRCDRLDRAELPGTLLFADLDHFKELNDHCGHERGDAALRRFAALLRDTVRPSDLVARFGGDEFALWLDGADELAAAERADHLCRAVATSLAPESCPGCTLSVSIGIAPRWPQRDEDLGLLLHRADQAMYAVKRSGRGGWQVAKADSA